MMFCQYVLEPLEAILESLGAGLGVVLGLLGGPWGGSEHLGGTWGASWKSWRAPGGARGLYFTSIFVNLCCCLKSKKSMNKSGGAILCRNLQCPVGIPWVAGGLGNLVWAIPWASGGPRDVYFYEYFCVRGNPCLLLRPNSNLLHRPGRARGRGKGKGARARGPGPVRDRPRAPRPGRRTGRRSPLRSEIVPSPVRSGSDM